MKRFIPIGNRRVITATVVLVLAIATNALWRNPVSGVVIVITSIAIAVWYGEEMSKGSSGSKEPPVDPEPPEAQP